MGLPPLVCLSALAVGNGVGGIHCESYICSEVLDDLVGHVVAEGFCSDKIFYYPGYCG